MKILFLLTQDLESPSGLGRYFPMALELVNLGHQINILALHSNFTELNEKYYARDGIDVRYVGQMHVRKEGNEKAYFKPFELLKVTLRSTIAMCKAALDTPTDMVIIGKPHPMNSIAGIIARIMKHLPLIVDCDDYETGSGHFQETWQKKVISFFERQVPRHAKVVLTNTYFMKEKLITWGVPPMNIHYIPNGVDTNRFQKPSDTELNKLRSSLGLDGFKVISFIGSLSLTNHHIDILFDAYRMIINECKNTKLLVVGGGEDFRNLKKLVIKNKIESDVIFQGRINKDEVVLYYHLSDVTIDPVYDNDAARGRSPLKMFESWYCGIPFITADVGDRKYLMGTPQAGLLVKPGDPVSLADAIKYIINDEGIKQSLTDCMQTRVKEFQWNEIAIKLHRILCEIY